MDLDIMLNIQARREDDLICILNHEIQKKLDKGILSYNQITTFLSESVRNNLFNVVKLLLERKVNVNGIQEEGYSFESPIYCTSFIPKNSHFFRMVNLLIYHGADINHSGITRYSLLKSCIRNKERVLFLLKRGIDPNLHRENLPLESAYINFKNNKTYDTEYIFKLLLFYGANPFLKNRKGYSVYDMCLKDNYPLNIDKIIEELVEEKEYKIKKRKIEDNKEYINKTSTLGDDINSKQIISYMEKDKIWAFHHDEVNILLKFRKNPYTNIPLTQDFINHLYTIDHYPIIEEIKMMYESNINKKFVYTNNDRLKLLSEFIASFNCYIQTHILSELTLRFLAELYIILSEDEDISLFYLLSCSKDLIYEKLLKRILNNIYESKLLVSKVSTIIDQVITDYLVYTDMKNLMEENMLFQIKNMTFDEVKEFLNNDTYEQLCLIFYTRYKNRRYDKYWVDIVRFIP